MQKESTCLSEFGVTNETKTDSRILFVPLVTPFLYRYNGLLFSSGTRIETDMLWDKDAIVVIDNPTAVYPDVDVITVEDRTGVGDVRSYERVEKKSDVKVTLFDGEGVISPAFAKEIDRLALRSAYPYLLPDPHAVYQGHGA